jgi:hypothetical protein
MREVKLVKSGQLRKWCGVHAGEDGVFLVLHPYAIPIPGSDWVDNGWYVLQNGRQQWVFEADIEDDSDVLEEPVQVTEDSV